MGGASSSGMSCSVSGERFSRLGELFVIVHLERKGIHQKGDECLVEEISFSLDGVVPQIPSCLIVPVPSTQQPSQSRLRE